MLNKKIKGRILKVAVFSILFAVAIFLLPDLVLAQIDTGIDYGEGTGLSDTDPRIIVANVIRVVLGFLGIIALFLILYAGWMYMSSAGAPDKIEKAKKILSSALIGLVIILSAFAIASFILNALIKATGGNGSSTTGPGTNFNSGIPVSGNNIIESHYPERDQVNVPRNTGIVVTFKEDMRIDDIISDNTSSDDDWDDDNGNDRMDDGEAYNTINSANILIYKDIDGSSVLVTDVFAAVVPGSSRTFYFKPTVSLGSQSDEMLYVVSLSSAIRKANNDRAFPSVMDSVGYSWSFMVSTIEDHVPPRIISIIPRAGNLEPRNVVVQINFNEAINPISASGNTSIFNNIEVNEPGPLLVDGSFYISNRYRTVEFLTDDLCGRNSCGDNVYCLPATSTINVLAKAADLLFTDSAEAYFPFTGVVDMASNSLDGNGDRTAQGPEDQDITDFFIEPYNKNSPDPLTQGDSLEWTFQTSEEILLSPPHIVSVSPGFNEPNVARDLIPTATFNRLLMSRSMIKHTGSAPGSVAYYTTPPVFFWLSKFDGEAPDQTTIEIRHSRLSAFATTTPVFKEGIKDIYQNCFYPTSAIGAGITCTPTPTSTLPAPYCCDGAISTSPCN